MMAIPFDALWEKAEGLHPTSIEYENVSEIMDELTLKINLYRTLDQKGIQLPVEDLRQAKSRTMGEILLTLTKLSLKDNINVYEALVVAMNARV